MRIEILLMVLFIIFVGWFSGYLILSLIGAILGAYMLSKPASEKKQPWSPEPQKLGSAAHVSSEGMLSGAKNIAQLSGFLVGRALEIKGEVSKVRAEKKKKH